jgi:hypothetical protein
MDVVRYALVASVFALAACNALADNGKYDVVDCPKGDCSDAGGTTPASSSGGVGDAGAESGADAGFDAGPPCPANQARVTLTVTSTTTSDTAQSNPGGLSVHSGSTGSSCFALDTLEIRMNQSNADWTGASCKDGNTGRDRCEFTVPAAGATITAALP